MFFGPYTQKQKRSHSLCAGRPFMVAGICGRQWEAVSRYRPLHPQSLHLTSPAYLHLSLCGGPLPVQSTTQCFSFDSVCQKRFFCARVATALSCEAEVAPCALLDADRPATASESGSLDVTHALRAAPGATGALARSVTTYPYPYTPGSHHRPFALGTRKD